MGENGDAVLIHREDSRFGTVFVNPVGFSPPNLNGADIELVGSSSDPDFEKFVLKNFTDNGLVDATVHFDGGGTTFIAIYQYAKTGLNSATLVLMSGERKMLTWIDLLFNTESSGLTIGTTAFADSDFPSFDQGEGAFEIK